jgi:hypothetical protein
MNRQQEAREARAWDRIERERAGLRAFLGIDEHGRDLRVCNICRNGIHSAEGKWVHDQPYDPFATPIHAPRPAP